MKSKCDRFLIKTIPASVVWRCDNAKHAGPTLIAVLVVLISLAACENDFSPKTDFQRRIAVFAVLNPEAEMQVVRVAYSYDAKLGVPPEALTEREVESATVRVRRGGVVYTFRDTVFLATDGSRVRAWISRDLQPLHEHEYRLEVSIPDAGEVHSTVLAPSRMYVAAERVPADTGDGYMRVHPGVAMWKMRPEAFYYRVWVGVQVRENGRISERRAEVPLRSDPMSGQWMYTVPQREAEQRLEIKYVRMLADSLAGADTVVSRRVYVRGYVMDGNFYSYYKIVRGFDDPVSVRLDKPDISFIEGGLGVFGVLLPDSADYLYSRFVK